jgi:hypothetical protein
MKEYLLSSNLTKNLLRLSTPPILCSRLPPLIKQPQITKQVALADSIHMAVVQAPSRSAYLKKVQELLLEHTFAQ